MSLRLQPSDFGLADDPKRPVLSALGRACANNMSDLAAVVEKATALTGAPNSKTEEDVKSLLEEATRFVKERCGAFTLDKTAKSTVDRRRVSTS